MSALESSVLGILAVLATGYIAKHSIEGEIARIIAIAATLFAFWILAAIVAEQLIGLILADLFGEE